jgi:hypothetical protein
LQWVEKEGLPVGRNGPFAGVVAKAEFFPAGTKE